MFKLMFRATTDEVDIGRFYKKFLNDFSKVMQLDQFVENKFRKDPRWGTYYNVEHLEYSNYLMWFFN
jgi:hypothetical protein